MFGKSEGTALNHGYRSRIHQPDGHSIKYIEAVSFDVEENPRISIGNHDPILFMDEY